mgnify:CR=1 FL=1
MTKKSKDKDITYDQFVSHLNAGNKGYMKKPRSWQKCWFWWEDKDQWFLNKAYDQRKDGVVQPEESSWITANDLPNHLPFMERKGYKYYIDE